MTTDNREPEAGEAPATDEHIIALLDYASHCLPPAKYGTLMSLVAEVKLSRERQSLRPST